MKLEYHKKYRLSTAEPGKKIRGIEVYYGVATDWFKSPIDDKNPNTPKGGIGILESSDLF